MKRLVAPYTIAIGSVIVATAIRSLLDSYLEHVHLFSWYYAAVSITAWHCGLRPSLLALLLGYVAADWFFIEPRGSLIFNNSNPDEWIGLATYFVVGLAIVACIEGLRRCIRQPVQIVSVSETTELIAVAFAVRDHGLRSTELSSYLAGLNASPEMFQVASHYELFDMEPTELAASLEDLAKRGRPAAPHAPASV